MRAISALVLLCLAAFAAAWSKEDHEIFRLNDEVQKHEGHNVTFYSWLGITPSASQSDINKAYRKLSRSIHPDKARSNFIASYNLPKPSTTKAGAKPTVHVQKNKQPSKGELNKFNKEASARFERLSLIANVLRGAERQRYDHFLRNGFSTWRGTGYYYERFRPGLGTVLFGLFIFGGGAVHYAVLFLTYRQRREFGERYVKHARRTAWGDDSGINSIPGVNGNSSSVTSGSAAVPENEEAMQYNRKQKRAMEKEKRKDAKNPIKAAAKAAAAEKEKAKASGVSTPVEPEEEEEEEERVKPVGAKKRTVAQNGKVLIVDSVGNVFLEEFNAEGVRQEFLIDPSAEPKPRITDTVLFRLPIFLYESSIGRFLNKAE